MRFKAKIDYSQLLIPVIVVAMGGFTVKIEIENWLMYHHTLDDLFNDPIGIFNNLWLFAIAATFLFPFLSASRAFCLILQNDGLLLFDGRETHLIPFSNLERILPISGERDWIAPGRIKVEFDGGKSYTIALRERERFLAQLSEKCPQSERRETHVGFSLQRPLAF